MAVRVPGIAAPALLSSPWARTRRSELSFQMRHQAIPRLFQHRSRCLARHARILLQKLAQALAAFQIIRQCLERNLCPTKHRLAAEHSRIFHDHASRNPDYRADLPVPIPAKINSLCFQNVNALSPRGLLYNNPESRIVRLSRLFSTGSRTLTWKLPIFRASPA
jgi:hypothetical protein